MQGGTTYSDRTEYTNNTTTGDKTYEVHWRKERLI
jgi:hypothetical protein